MSRPIRRLTVVAAALLVLALAGAPVSAKEFETTRLDAPIPMGVPGGTELLVGVTVSVVAGASADQIDGSSIYLRLTGRSGERTSAMGQPEGVPGHYVMRIVVPAGGTRAVEVGIRGSTDLKIELQENPLAFGGITPRTAQAAPLPTPLVTPLPHATAVPAPLAVAGTTDPAKTPTPAPVAPAAVVLLAAGMAAAGLAAFAARRRRTHHVGRARGA